jgi:hypothetical protein
VRILLPEIISRNSTFQAKAKTLRGFLNRVGVGGISQGCKLLSDIGQCPTKFGKCPSKSNFDVTKKLSHYTLFCCDKIRLQIHSICILQIKFPRRSSI